jgi:predicted DNA-binding transcriptional regulator YafY
LPPELRGRAARIRERFLVDEAAWFRQPEQPAALATLAEAVWSQRRLELRYASGSAGAVRRTVEPLGLVMKAGVYYLVARHRGQPRSYRVGKIARARLAAQDFERPADFDLAAFWADALRSFDARLMRLPCRIRVSARGFRMLPDVIPSEALRAQLAAAGPAAPDGSRELELRLESEAVAASQLLALGDEAEVLAPAGLRQRLHALAARVAARHA